MRNLPIFLSLLAAWIAVEQAFACSCEFSADVAAEVKRVSAVFIGTTVKREEIKREISTSIGTEEEPGWLWHFRVSKAWKGVETDQFKGFTRQGGAACGYPFEPNREYLVYAYCFTGCDDPANMEISTCSRTRPLAEATEDIEALGEPTVTLVEATVWGLIKALFY